MGVLGVLLLGWAALGVLPGRALFIQLTEGQQRCFQEEVPEDTLVVGDYKGVRAMVTDPSGQVVKRHDFSASGRFAFTASSGGEHQICLSTNSTRWMGSPRTLRVDIRFSVGEMAIDYADVARKEHLSELEVQVRRLNDKSQDIMRELGYQRKREIQFRDTSESTCERVLWWSLVQMGVMLAGGLWSTMHLLSFLQREKVK